MMLLILKVLFVILEIGVILVVVLVIKYCLNLVSLFGMIICLMILIFWFWVKLIIV